MKDTEIEVLLETCKSANKAVETIERILYKVYDQNLAYDLYAQTSKYRELERKAKGVLKKGGLKPKKDTVLEKFTTWFLIQTGTALNISTPYIANMVIADDSRRISRLMKVTHNNKIPNSYANEIAKEFMDFEEKNIEKLKSYL